MEQITLNQLKRSKALSEFLKSYNNLLLGRTQNLDDEDLRYLLRTSIVLLNYGDDSLQRLGYRIVLRYSILTGRYRPLYDVAINKGFIPVSKQIEDKHFADHSENEGFFRSYFSAYHENFKDQNVYLSYGQKRLIELANTSKNNIVVVAPTSYGKSEMIIRKIQQKLGSYICIIVPSKALLAQTKKRILNSDIADQIGRIITHSEMYRGDEESFVSVLTQERLLRLMQKNPALKFDYIFIDEAHNLFKGDNRATLLAQVIMIIKKRNSNAILNFFSPFISDHSKLRIPHSNYQLESIRTSESIKVEKYFYCDMEDGKMYLYDQFVNDSVRYNRTIYKDEISFIKTHQAEKNIVYLNKPKDIQQFALNLAESMNDVKAVREDIITTIADFLHPAYHLLKCIKAGVVYHHGGMPEIIRLYVEDAFSQNKNLKFIITSSTLLEGVNIPAEKIFLLSNKIGRRNFTKSEFKNLIGRVCRFSEIFHHENGRLEMLEPEIFLIRGKYYKSRSTPLKFFQEKAKIDIKLDDEVANLLLKDDIEIESEDDRKQIKEKLEYLENIEPNTVDIENVKYVTTEIGKLCYKNNVYDFDIRASEDQLNRNLRRLNAIPEISTTDDLMETINKIFFRNIVLDNENLLRLTNLSARKFYSMVLDWRASSTSYKEMIANFMGYWNNLDDKVVYFGSAWGEVSRNEDAFVPKYIDLADKSNIERINLAIIKIKEEQDFVEFNLLKYIDILQELEMLNSEFYEQIKYGSSDRDIISLLKNGFSIELAKILIEKYRQFVVVNNRTDDVSINQQVVDAMLENAENKILVFEINYHIKLNR